MKINDALVGVVLALVGSIILFHIQAYPTIPGQKYGPAIFPGVIATGLVVCGLLLVRTGLRSGAPMLQPAPWLRSPRGLARFVGVLTALAFYIIAADTLGFIVTGALILIALFLQNGVRIAVAIPVAIVATAVVHALFYKLMRVPLPWGVLERVAW